MGLFGPSSSEIRASVSDGIWDSIRTSRTRQYKVKVGAMKVEGKYLVIPNWPEMEITEFDLSTEVTINTTNVYKDVNDMIFDIVYEDIVTEHNPFTDVKKVLSTMETNIERFYEHEGWTLADIKNLLHYANIKGYFPERDLAKEILKEEIWKKH